MKIRTPSDSPPPPMTSAARSGLTPSRSTPGYQGCRRGDGVVDFPRTELELNLWRFRLLA
ncbi:hypothetical protein PHJA_002437800 [Phtheirospermum japonicum]|uniref:Uncharacterized protein n=1 Tax=Phtheirospermum japonicum TaxID=374723 RepID=A0A830CVA1_9LAMI|nr:hypothetical protein PHJA_002437800 [Phtheirospermum japonicum]